MHNSHVKGQLLWQSQLRPSLPSDCQGSESLGSVLVKEEVGSRDLKLNFIKIYF